MEPKERAVRFCVEQYIKYIKYIKCVCVCVCIYIYMKQAQQGFSFTQDKVLMLFGGGNVLMETFLSRLPAITFSFCLS